MPIDVRSLVGFVEESLDLEFEGPAKLTFSISNQTSPEAEQNRADEPLLDLTQIYQYKLDNGSGMQIALSGLIKVIREHLSPDEDRQFYTLEDRYNDFKYDPLLGDAECGATSRFFLNPDGTVTIDGGVNPNPEPGDLVTGPENTLYKLVNRIIAGSTIVPCVEWPATENAAAQADALQSGAPVERNIPVEGRGRGDMLEEVLKYNPRYRVHINSVTGCMRIVNLEKTPIKVVHLDKISGKYYLNNPESDVIEIDFNIDRTECFQKVRLEGRGQFQNQVKLLDPAWPVVCPGFISGALVCPDDFSHVGLTYNPANPTSSGIDGRYWAAGTLRECLRRWYANAWLFPSGAMPAPFVFNKETGQLSREAEAEILIEAAVPTKNNGCCDLLATVGRETSFVTWSNCIPRDPSPNAECPNGQRYCWTGKNWIEVARVKKLPRLDTIESFSNQLVPINRYIWDSYPTKYFAMFGAGYWQGGCPGATPSGCGGAPPDLTDKNPCPLPCDPKIEPYAMRAHYTEQFGCLVFEASGGCPNGRVYQRYNSDWFDFKDESGAYIRHDSFFMQQFANNLMIAVGRPKVSATITIYLRPVDCDATTPEVWFGNKDAGNNQITYQLGDRINIQYAAPGTEDYSPGPGELKNGMDGYPPNIPAGNPGIAAIPDKNWSNMELNIMSMKFDRRGQKLTLQLADSVYIFGDKLLQSLQR